MKVFLVFLMVLIGSFLLPVSETQAQPSRAPAVEIAEPQITCLSLQSEGADFVSGQHCTLSSGEKVDSVLLPKAQVSMISLVRK